MSNQNAGRLFDRSHKKEEAATASEDVLINNRPALRVGDRGAPKTWNALEGAPAVLINGRRAHRCGDAHERGCLIEGSANVLVGDHAEQPTMASRALLVSATWDQNVAHTGEPVGITVTASNAEGQSVLIEITLDNHPDGNAVVDSFLLGVAAGTAECAWTCEIDWDDNPETVDLPHGGFPQFRLIARLERQRVDGGLLEIRQDLVVRHALLPPENMVGHPLHARLADGRIVEASFNEDGVVVFRDLVPGPCKTFIPYVAG